MTRELYSERFSPAGRDAVGVAGVSEFRSVDHVRILPFWRERERATL